MTDSLLTDRNTGATEFNLVRNVTIDGIGGDAFSNSGIIINSTITDFVQSQGSHSDLYQSVGAAHNVILYGVNCTQNIGAISSDFQFNEPPTDLAVVNCNLKSGGVYSVQWGGVMTNLLFKNTAFDGGMVYLNGFSPTDVVFDGCTFTSNLGPYSGVTYK
jgi:hypothetical protein